MKIIETSNYIEKVAKWHKNFTPDQVKEMIRLNTQEGWSVRDIAKKYKVDPSTIRTKIRQYGGEAINHRSKNFSPEQIQEMIKLNQEGWTASDLAEKYQTSYQTIISKIKENGGEIVNHLYKDFSPEQIQEMIRLNNQEGLSLGDLAKKYKSHPHTIAKKIKENGGEIVNHLYKSFTPKQIQEMIRLNNQEGLSLDDIAKKYKSHPHTIAKKIKENGGVVKDHRHSTFSPEQIQEMIRLNNQEGWSLGDLAEKYQTTNRIIANKIRQNGGVVVNNRIKDFSPEQIQEMIRLNNQEGLSVLDIAKKYKSHPSTIAKNIKEKGGVVIHSRNKDFTPDQVKEMIRLNTQEGWTVRDIAEKYKADPTTITNKIRQYGGEVVNHLYKSFTPKQIQEMIRLNNQEGWSLGDLAKKYEADPATIKTKIIQYGGEIKENDYSDRGKVTNNKSTQSITEQKFSSINELIIQDVFAICNISFEKPKSIRYEYGRIIPDYYFPTGNFYFEVFGYGGANEEENNAYQNKMNKKIQKITNLKYIDIRGKGIRGLIKCAAILDTQVCVKQQCGQSLFSNISVQQTLATKIPLLEKFGISLCTTYIKRLQEMSPQQLGKARKAIERTPVQHQPFPQTQPLNNPNIFRQQNQKIAQSEPISLQQIVSELSQQYESVQSWTPEEQVAVYFKTPENLQAAMGNNQNYNFQNYFNLNQQTQQIPQSQMARAAMVYKGDTNG